jgi:hypothetical protein
MNFLNTSQYLKSTTHKIPIMSSINNQFNMEDETEKISILKNFQSRKNSNQKNKY